MRFIQRLLGHLHLQTTTIYTRLAVLRGERATSPLDLLEKTERAPTSTAKAPERSVGRLRLAFRPRERSADVDVLIRGDPDVLLDGVHLDEPRPGFLTLSLPPLEAWTDRLAWLPREVRERVEEGSFYENLLEAIRSRWRARSSEPVAGSG